MNDVKTILEQHEDLRQFLFVRGFLMTDNDQVPAEGYPFYGAWNCETHGAFKIGRVSCRERV